MFRSGQLTLVASRLWVAVRNELPAALVSPSGSAWQTAKVVYERRRSKWLGELGMVVERGELRIRPELDRKQLQTTTYRLRVLRTPLPEQGFSWNDRTGSPLSADVCCRPLRISPEGLRAFRVPLRCARTGAQLCGEATTGRATIWFLAWQRFLALEEMLTCIGWLGP